MDAHYLACARMLKTLSDPSRLRIVDMLSCGEKCACELLDSFNFTQPTLSHHMRVLMESGLVRCRQEGLWRYYSLDTPQCEALLGELRRFMSFSQDCVCHRIASAKTCNNIPLEGDTHENNADF